MRAQLTGILLAALLATSGGLRAQTAGPGPAPATGPAPAGGPAAAPGTPAAGPGASPAGRDTAAADDRAAAVQPRIRPIAVAKWSALAATTAAAVYGYHQNRMADSRYEDLDRLCQTQPARCQARTSSGAYGDAELESRFQEVRRLDHRAAMGLVGAEIGVAATVTLFLLDLRHAERKPPDIPYTPPRIQLVPGRNGRTELRVTRSGPRL